MRVLACSPRISLPVRSSAFALAAIMGSYSVSARAADTKEFPSPTMVNTNGIRLAIYEQGKGFPVVLCHGFPELAYSWRHQLPALAAAGYHAIAPDQRGYGASDKPEAVEAYSIDHLSDDLVGVLNAKGIKQAIFCGHDWGGAVV